MSTYLFLNLLIIIVPLILSFESKIKYYKKFKNLTFAILPIAGIFIVWDSYAAARGDWFFNQDYIFNFKIFYLPIEEILFFITVPYSIIFLYETAKLYINDANLRYNKLFYTIVSVIFFIISLFFVSKYYTFTVLIFTSVTILFLNFITPYLLKSRIFIYLLLFSYIPFFIFNYFFTSLPIIEYGANAILGIRVITIPIEDFLYSFSLISLYIAMYELSFKLWQKKQ